MEIRLSSGNYKHIECFVIVHNVSQIIETGAESDSEEDEEWNYVRGEEANKENLNPLQLNSQVAEEEEEDTEDTMSQLNPNAAEFVPISPTRNVASPLGRVLSDDLVLSQSPKKPPSNEELDLNIPSPVDFENDISQKPHEIEEAISNGHQNDLDNDICVTNSAPNNKTDEFLFGPNAAPFTPVKLLDQSEVSSTKAVYGDESDLSQIMSFNDSTFSQDQNEFVQKDDPMSMSFHQDRIDDGNPFDLNKVHQLPEDVDAFIAKADKSDSLLNDTISDLDEHFPLGKPQESGDILITDLDNKDFKHEDNKVTSTLEDDIVEPLKQLGLDTSCEQNRTSSPLEEAITPLVEEVNSTTPFEVKEFSSSVEENQSISPLQEDIASPVEEEIGFSVKEESLISPQETIFPVEEKAMSFLVDERETSSPEDEKEIISHLEEKEKNSQVEEKEISSPIEQKEFESAAEEDRLNNPLVDQIIKNDFVSEFEGVESSHVFESSFEPLQVSTSCDNSESPQHSEPVTSEPSPNNDEFVKLETEKSDIEKAKENVDNLLNLDPLSSAKYSEEQCLLPDTTVNEIVNINEPSSVPINSDLLCALSTTSQDEPEQEIKKEEINEEQHISSIQQENKDVVSSSITEPNQIPDSFDDSTRSIDVDSHSTPEIDHLLGNNSDAACLLNNSVKSTVDTESVTTTEVNSFLQRSLLAEMESPLSPNVSEIHLDVDEQAVLPTVNVQSPVGDLLQVECAVESTLLSPNRDEQHITGVTSTPAPEKSSPLSPLIPEVKAGIPLSPVEDKTPKAPPKEGDKKTTKQKATPVSSTKKTPTPRSSLAGAKAPTPSPRPASSKLSAKASPVPSKVNSTTKTESKTNVKPLVSAAPKSSTTTARVPLASRTKPATVTKTTENKTLTNGEAKPSRPASGAVKKTLEVSSARSAASTGTGKPTSTTAKVPLASARGAVPATVPKPRPNTLKPAPSKTTSATATKSTTSVKATTAPKVPPAQKTSASLANKDVKAPITKTFPKPRPATEKHIKETANKLTASRTTTKTTSTTQVLSKTSITRKTDEKVTGTKTTTSRTSTTTATARPISRGTKTSATKVGKPKENGVATVHTEQIIVSDVNGINSNEQFVKDNSPVDNKLIVDSLTETAAI
ncbi:hypothetical protein HHI36_009049 [Cryptolaemus montrouzieri]|uniref:Ataxin-2 C-terminal domain-containing protein n=1 Tax=Cryptolaemus montrouzieri TaxID=559131 RepID=A0ABD2MUM5_9CUCU